MAETVTGGTAPASAPSGNSQVRPWPALWAVCLGFFMILVDATIVFVATPAIMGALHTDVNSVVWVTSAYLLAYAVPLLITGRLGDRVGPKTLYLGGLTLFTLSSFWCGMTGTIAMLVLARVFQGLGAALMTPQTMAIITRVFPATRRGQAMGVWGAVAGVASLVGPIAGGVLVDNLGWQWIFFVNVPVGFVAFALAWKLVPSLQTHVHTFDLGGVALSGIGMFLLVFGIQEGQSWNWSAGIWEMIAGGLVVLGAFVWWQRRNTGEPLVPLSLFRDRNFSIANAAITTVGFAIIALSFPLMLYAQEVLGLSPTRAALLMVPTAVISGVLAPFVGRLSDTMHPRYVAGIGMLALPAALAWLAAEMRPHAAIWTLLLPIALLGVANGFMWSPLSTTATRNLPMSQAGAGSGIYNTTRQVGGVLGSAAIGVLMQARLGADLPAAHGGSFVAGRGPLPAMLHSGFAQAMAQSMLLPAFVGFLGFVAVLFFARPSFMRRAARADQTPSPVAA